MPTKPVLLASGGLPLHGERLTVAAVTDALRPPLSQPYRERHHNKTFLRFWPAEQEGWSHAFLAIVASPTVDVRTSLHLLHGLGIPDLRAAAEQRLSALGMPLGAQRSPERSRALHDLTVSRADCPEGVVR